MYFEYKPNEPSFKMEQNSDTVLWKDCASGPSFQYWHPQQTFGGSAFGQFEPRSLEIGLRLDALVSEPTAPNKVILDGRQLKLF